MKLIFRKKILFGLTMLCSLTYMLTAQKEKITWRAYFRNEIRKTKTAKRVKSWLADASTQQLWQKTKINSVNLILCSLGCATIATGIAYQVHSASLLRNELNRRYDEPQESKSLAAYAKFFGRSMASWMIIVGAYKGLQRSQLLNPVDK